MSTVAMTLGPQGDGPKRWALCIAASILLHVAVVALIATAYRKQDQGSVPAVRVIYLGSNKTEPTKKTALKIKKGKYQ